MAPHTTLKRPNEAERLEAIKVFLRSFRNESESSEKWLDHFTRMLIGANLAHLLVAVEAGGDAPGGPRGDGKGGVGRSEGAGPDDRHTTVVGSGALICFARTAWIALMGVEPGLQKKGIGDSLMAALLDLARELGYNTVKLDATNFGRGLYARHGFVDEYPVSMYEIPPRCDPGGPGGPRVRLDDELPEWCLAMDLEAVGEDRSALLRAVLADGGKVLMVEGVGFGILHGRKVGPVVAGSVEAAIAIVQRADSFGVNRIYVPRHPELSEEFLAGLKEIPPSWDLKCCTRMIKGEPVEQNLKLEFAGYSAATG
jgi:GNAT superfamily N-acetyltransferase